MNADLVKKQSTMMDTLRFPLIMLVLIIHVIPSDTKIVTLDWTSHNLYLFATELISHNFGRIAVPIFFLISGYLFFNKAPQNFEGQYFLTQWKKRISTLILPYLLWNLLKYLTIGGKGYIQNLLGLGGLSDIEAFQLMDIHTIFIGSLNEPLWYVRDLIGMSIISPLFFILFRSLKHWGLLLLALWYFSNLEIGIHGFSLTAIFYFGIGAYYSLNKRLFLNDFIKLGYIPFTLSILILIVGTLTYNVERIGKEYWLRPAILLGVIGTFQVMSKLADRYPKLQEICLKQVGNVFFIYAVHEIYLKNWTNGLFARIDIPNTYADNIITYPLQALFLLVVCLGINYLTKKYLPKLYAVLTGGRI